MSCIQKHLLVSLSPEGMNVRLGENLGIRYLKSYLESFGFYIDILEVHSNNESSDFFKSVIRDYDTIGFSLNFCGQVSRLKKILRDIDMDKKIIYLGGHVATFCYKNLMHDFSEVKFVVVSEGEISMLRLFQSGFTYQNVANIAYRVDDNIIINNPIKFVENLDELPFPYRDEKSYFMGDKHFSMISSRGCYHSCSYCSVGSYTKKFLDCRVRFRSAENVLEEIEHVHKKYGVTHISFQDDLFLDVDAKSQNRAKKISELLLARDINVFFSIMCSVKAINEEVISLLYNAGLRNVFIGIENFSEKARAYFNKHISDKDIEHAISVLATIGVEVDFGFIMFYPEMKHEEILLNVSRLYELNLINLRSISNALSIYIGTEYETRIIDSIVVNRDDYVVQWRFRDELLNDLLNKYRIFSSKYKKQENQLAWLRFHSYTNTEIDGEYVYQLSTAFRNFIYEFAVSNYNFIFMEAQAPDIINHYVPLINDIEQYYQKINHSAD